MFRRVILFIILCLLAIFFLGREQRRGTFEGLERGYLDTLIGYSSDQIGKSSVTFLRLDKDEARVFQEWPLTALDFGVLLKNLKTYKPSVVAIEPTLDWEKAQPYYESAFLNQAVGLNRLVVGAELELDGPGKGHWEFEQDVLSNVNGDLESVPQFTGVARSASAAILDHSKTGFTGIEFGDQLPKSLGGALRVPMIARAGDLVVPSLILRILMEQYEVPVEDVVVEVGNFIRLGGAVKVPIDHTGSLTISGRSRARLIRHNATLLVPIDVPEENDPDALGESPEMRSLSNQVVLFGDDSEESRRIPLGSDHISRAEMIALAISTVQSNRFLQQAPRVWEYLVWGLLILLGAWRMCLRRMGWMVIAGIFVLWLMGSMIVFQSTMYWIPPAIPLWLIIITALGGYLLPQFESERPERGERSSAPPVRAS